MISIRPVASILLSVVFALGLITSASAANTHSILDPQELPFASGYDAEKMVFTLHADFSLTAEVFPYGVPGDADGDGDPNASSNPAITDEPGVGSLEFLEIDMECGATGPAATCTPNVTFIYNANTLLVFPANPAVTGLEQYVTFEVLLDRYVLTITDLVAFKTALGIPVTNTVNFGAFSFAAHFDDGQPDDVVPDSGNCEFVNLEPPVVAQCALVLDKVSSVTTVGPLAVQVGNDSDSDSDSDSGNDHDGSGDSDDSDADSGDDSVANPTIPPPCGCKGKVTDLTLLYTGAGSVLVDIDRIGPFATDIFAGTVQAGAPFTISGSDFGPKGFKGTLGVAIGISVDGGPQVELHTSCSEPIGEGQVVGDFVILSGNSRKLTQPLCPFIPDACPINQQVTYTYTVTNNGSDVTGLVVTDDKMTGNVGGPVDLLANASVMFQADACLFETTTNTAQASGLLSDGQACLSNTDSVTVELLPPPDPDPCIGVTDSDSDSGYDTNLSGDSDDSDADSGDADCDGDSDLMPLVPVTYEGCGPGYWKKHRDAWTTYTPGDRFDSIFGVDAAGSKTLMRTLKAKGGGGASKKLGRQAVAALQNAANPAVNYLYTPGEVIAIVVDAYARFDFATAANVLKEQNKKGCPINP